MRTSVIFLGLAAVGTAVAHPHSVSCSTSSRTQLAPPSTSTSTPISSSTSTSPSTRDASAQLFQDVFSAPTAITRFQRLLVQGGSLLTGDALRKLIVFDFNGAQPASGALGGTAKAAVSTMPGLILKIGIATLTRLLCPDHRDLPVFHRLRHQPDGWLP